MSIGDVRKGEVIEVLSDGSAVVEWSDGTTGVLKAKRPAPGPDGLLDWERDLLSSVFPIYDRYGEMLSEIDPVASEVITEAGEIIDRDTFRLYCEHEVSVIHQGGNSTQYRKDGTVTQYDPKGNVYTRES